MFDQDQTALPVLVHRYRLQNELGSGGMGVVYRAYDRLNGQTVAVKLINVPPEYFEFMSRATTSNLLVPLAREFQTLATLRHPNIISVLDYGFAGADQPFLVMELLEKARELSAAGSDQPVEAQMGLIGQVLQALKYLHRHGIVHCDLKPSNVLVSERGVARLLDFGLALRQGQAAEGGGTLGYMSPEVLGGGRATPLSDLYAVGVMAYELLAGRLPHYHGNVEKMAQAILEAPADLDPVPAAWREFVGRLLEKEPGARYASAGEALAGLQAGLGQPEAESVTIRESYLQAAPFVGREQEVQTLTAALTNAKAGNGSSWLVGGESGVGKSRLLDEVRTQAQVEGFLVLRGQAVEGGGLPYQLWREPLRRLALTVEMSDLEAGILKPIVPDIAALLEREVPDAPELTGEALKQRLSLTVVDVFRRSRQPVALLLEDMQWSSESLEPLKRLNALAADLSLLIVANYRSDERPDLPDELPDMTPFLLARLSDDEVAELSAGMLGEGGRDPAVVERLQQETEGNTFFMVEVVRALAEAAGRLGDIGQMTLPRSIFAGGIQKIVRRRLEHVPAWGQTLLRLAAVAGRQIDLGVLDALVEQGADLGGHTRDEWVRACADVAVLDIQDEHWRFAHDKLREGLLDSLSDDALPHYHRLVAQAFEEVYAAGEMRMPYLETLLSHWQRAGDIEKEIDYGLEVGSTYMLRGQHPKTLQLMERILQLSDLPHLPDALSIKAKALRLLGSTYYELSDHPKAADCFTQAITFAEQLGDQRFLGMLSARLAKVLIRQGKPDEARPYIEKSLVIGRSEADPQILTRTYAALAHIEELDGNYHAAEQLHRDALPMYEALGDREGESECLNNIGVIQKELGNYATAVEYYQRSYEVAKAVGARSMMGYALGNIGGIYAERGELELAIQSFQESLVIRREIGERRGTSIDLINLAYMAIQQMDWEQAEAWARESHQLAVEGDEQWLVAITQQALGEALMGKGDYRAARLSLEGGMTVARNIGARRWIVSLDASLGRLNEEEGDTQSALHHHNAALNMAREIEYREAIISNLGRIAFNQLMEGSGQAATASLLEATSLARAFPEAFHKLEFLTTAAECLAYAHMYDLALECDRFVAAHPKSLAEWKARLLKIHKHIAVLDEDTSKEETPHSIIDSDIDMLLVRIETRLNTQAIGTKQGLSNDTHPRPSLPPAE